MTALHAVVGNTGTGPTAELSAAWANWHTARERELATEHGWLSLVGFHWLPATPTRLQGVPGEWHVDGDHAVLQATESDNLVLAGQQDDAVVGTITAVVPEAGSLRWVRYGRVVVELVLRGGRYAIRLRDPQAPERAAFRGVPAFAVDPSWITPGQFTAFDATRRITVDTARADLRQQVTAVGTVELSLPDGRHTLVATAGQGGRVNLSFHDRTNQSETALWRVVSTSIPTETGALVVDFNRAVNLPFSFTEFGTCPAPVEGNHLPIAVTAGELAPHRVTP